MTRAQVQFYGFIYTNKYDYLELFTFALHNWPPT